MPRRPSVFVLALTVGDYLLWNWSLNGNHDVIALVSGLTLPPLALVSLWILVLGAMKLVATVAGVRRGVAVDPDAWEASASQAGPAAQRPQTRPTAAGAREDSRRIAA